MPNVNVSFNVKRPTGLLNTSQVGSNAAEYLRQALQAAISGTNQSDGVIFSVTDVVALGDIAYAGPAIGLLVASGGAGAMGGTIGGTLITTAFATSDTVTMTALAAAIRAAATVNRKVTATNVGMKVTLASVLVGSFIDICGVRFTAVNGTPVNFGEFDMSGTDTADATSLAQAINRHPSTAMRYRAVSSVGAVFVFPTTSRTLGPTQDKWAAIVNTGSFATFTVNSPVPVVQPACAVLATVPGDIGNEVRLTASGTGMTAVTNGSAGFLGGGTGGGASSNFVLP